MIVGVPLIHYRATYAHAKRLRVVTPGKFYRCGQLTASGLREAIDLYKIKLVINLQYEDVDPALPEWYFSLHSEISESKLCEQLGVRYFFLNFDLPPRDRAVTEQPQVIGEFQKLLDDPNSYPVLLHCKAGLHRTGLLTAVYRMEYEHWPTRDAMRELKVNGFGDWAATSADGYVYAFVELYQPRWRKLESQQQMGKKVDGAAKGASNQ